eukprot:5746551-Pyramimonas_sp.AAC.1
MSRALVHFQFGVLVRAEAAPLYRRTPLGVSSLGVEHLLEPSGDDLAKYVGCLESDGDAQ